MHLHSLSPPPGESVNLQGVLDPHTVAGLMKIHFREWKVSIIPRGKPLSDITDAVKEKDVRDRMNGRVATYTGNHENLVLKMFNLIYNYDFYYVDLWYCVKIHSNTDRMCMHMYIYVCIHVHVHVH